MDEYEVPFSVRYSLIKAVSWFAFKHTTDEWSSIQVVVCRRQISDTDYSSVKWETYTRRKR